MAAVSNLFGVYTVGRPSLRVNPTLSFECEKLKFLPTGQRILIQLKVSGENGWFEGKYDIELVPSSNKIILSTTKFSAEEGWIIKTYVTCSETYEGHIRVLVDGVHTTTVHLVFGNPPKDVFTITEVNRLLAEISYLVPFVEAQPALPEYRGNYCMGAAERGISELLMDYTNFYSVEQRTHVRRNVVSFSGKTAIDRGTKFQSLGFVKTNWKFNQYTINHNLREKISNSTNSSNARLNFETVWEQIIALSDAAKLNLYNLFLNDINSIGYHVYYFTIVGGFHTLLLVIDATKSPCEAEYKMYDQHGLKRLGQGKLRNIGEGYRKQTSFNFANSMLNRYDAGRANQWDKTFTQVWKIQKK